MRMLVVDDHPLIQEAVGNALRRLDPRIEIDVAGDCTTGLALAAQGAEPELVLLDLNLPGLSGIAGLKAWRSRFPAVPVIVLSATCDQQTVLAALGAGASGFIPKSSSNEVMLHAVRLVMDGGKYLPPEVLSASSSHEGAAPPPRRKAPSMESLGLTDRQVDVLRLIANGASNKIICRELGLAERTVKAHITAVLRTLNVTSRTQAALAAVRLGLPAQGQKGEERSADAFGHLQQDP
ncbi:response regulator transcription factor [Variovorax robiniae]|uniref:Response regulator transcription factor n=1 Tax=Variovorax robiniae TaxID=1836199 RepID=A0ABU8X5N2_9BURK